MSELPTELALSILERLDSYSLCRAAAVSRSWQAIATGCSNWATAKRVQAASRRPLCVFNFTSFDCVSGGTISRDGGTLMLVSPNESRVYKINNSPKNMGKNHLQVVPERDLFTHWKSPELMASGLSPTGRWYWRKFDNGELFISEDTASSRFGMKLPVRMGNGYPGFVGGDALVVVHDAANHGVAMLDLRDEPRVRSRLAFVAGSDPAEAISHFIMGAEHSATASL